MAKLRGAFLQLLCGRPQQGSRTCAYNKKSWHDGPVSTGRQCGCCMYGKVLEREFVACVHLVREMEGWGPVLNKTMDFLVPLQAGNLLTRRATIN
jgi:hypothetical protein